MMPQTVPVRMVPRSLARPRWGRVAVLLGLAVSLGVATRVPAATTWTVCASGCDYTSLKAAIAAPTTVDGDTLAIGAGVYTEPGIVVNKRLTVQGEDAATTIVQAAEARNQAPARVFTIAHGVSVTLQGLTIRYGRGRSYEYGGGIRNEGTLLLTNSTVLGNFAGSGGGLFNWGFATLTLINSTVRGNAAYSGGGLYNHGQLTLINSTVSGNATTGHGGGLTNGGTLLLINSTVHGNTTAVLGGGLWNDGGFGLTLIASTVSGNTATHGGLFNASYSPTTLTHSTVSGNAATGDGGGINSNYMTLTLTSSIVAKNSGGGDCLTERNHPIISEGYNLDSDGSCQLTAPTDLPGTDPLLGPLQDNGGPTLTHALRPGSPAMDAIPWGTNGCGTTLISDQRWQARPQPAGGACDIGASEVDVAGQALGAWVTGITPRKAGCENVTSGQAVTLHDPATPWDCEAAGLAVSSGDEVVLRVQGPVEAGASDVGGAVTGMAPTSGGCTNRTTDQEAPFQALFQGQRGATAASCVAAGLVIQPGDQVQMHVRGLLE
jgi:hypothetical protein